MAWSPSCTTGFGDGRCFGHDVQDQADQLQFEGGVIPHVFAVYVPQAIKEGAKWPLL